MRYIEMMNANVSTPAPASLSLRELLDKYGNSLWKEGSHRRNVYSFILEADEIFYNRRFLNFTDADLEQLQQALRGKKNSAATINRKSMALSKLLRRARKSGDVRDIPDFLRQKEPEERIRFLTLPEENYIFDRMGQLSADYRYFATGLVDTGARLSELVGLRWEEVSRDGHSLCLSKNNPDHERVIPATSRMKQILQSITRNNAGPFSTIDQAKFRAAWNQAKREVGLGDEKGIVPYILRHTCASRLVRGGVDLRRVQLWLGHRTLRMTLKYDYLSTNDLDICATVLDREVARGI